MELMDIATSTMQRLTLYKKYLQELPKQIHTVTPKSMAETLAIDPKIVLRDMKILLGKNRVNEEDREALEKVITKNTACRKVNAVVLVGVGKLGIALMGYAGFSVFDLDVVAGFDINEKIIKRGAFGKPVYHIDRLKEICSRLNAKIGIITTPGNCAQSACDALVNAGITAIWNYAAVRLNTPPGIMVLNEDMSSSLRRLAEHSSAHL
jgi:redox-sensing transcriptional repressor